MPNPRPAQLRAVRPEPRPELVVCRPDELRRLVADAVETALAESRGQAPVLLDREGLARALTVSLPTVDRLRKQGMPTMWVVQASRVKLADVLEWLGTQQPA